MKWFIGSLLVLSALFQAVSWQESSGQSAPPPCNCSQNNTTTMMTGGAYECAHGPEHNSECLALMKLLYLYPSLGDFSMDSDCEERNNAPPRTFTNPATGLPISFNCKCFECGKTDVFGKKNQCEDYIIYFDAYCQPVSIPTQGDGCPRHMGTVDEVSERSYKPLYNFNGVPCDYASGHEKKDLCGGGKVDIACKQPYGASQCVFDFAHPDFGPTRKLQKCGPEVIMP